MSKYRIKKADIEEYKKVIGIFYKETNEYKRVINEEIDFYVVYENEEYYTDFTIDKQENNLLSIRYKELENEEFILELQKILKQYPNLLYRIYTETVSKYFEHFKKYIEIIEEKEKRIGINKVKEITFKTKG